MTPDFLAPGIWSLTTTRVVLWLLVLTRVSGLLAALPGLGQERIPMTIRAALALLIATLLIPSLPGGMKVPQGLWDLIPLLLTEFMSGLLMGLVVAWIVDAVAFAGQIMDTQMGFAFVQLLDPGSATSASISGSILLQITVLFVFLSGLHHHMILALAESYRLVPMGAAIPMRPVEVILLVGQLLARGLQLAFPVLITLFFVDVLEGISAKLMPQLQLIQLSFPIKIAVGVAVFAVLLKDFANWLLPLYQRAPAEALRLLG